MFRLVIAALAIGAICLFILPRLEAVRTTTYGSYMATSVPSPNSMRFPGPIDVASSEALSAEAAGTVRKVYVEEGDDASADSGLAEIVDFRNPEVSIRVDEYLTNGILQMEWPLARLGLYNPRTA